MFKRLCRVTVLLSTLLVTTTQAVDIISWVPPYAVSTCKTVVNSNFGSHSVKDGLTRLGLQFWVPTHSGGVVKTKYNTSNADIEWFVDWGKTNNVKILLCIYNGQDGWDWPLARSAFKTNRTVFVSNLISVMEMYGLDGIDVDLEGTGTTNILSTDRADYKVFIQELSDALRARGKILTIDTFSSPLYNAPNMSWWTDWLGLVDGIHSMGYKNLYEGSSRALWGLPGYPFRYSWQYNYGVSEAKHPATNIHMGMPGWLSHWGSGGLGSNVVNHINEVKQYAPYSGVAIWDIRLTGTAGTPNWQSTATWQALSELKNTGNFLNITTIDKGTIRRVPYRYNYAPTENVTITAVPKTGYQFMGWRGSATGNTNPLTVSMSETRNITATFSASGSTSCTLTTSSINETITRNQNAVSYQMGKKIQD
jgi:uncharacterized repeat protein (TIGR02543 family)